VGEDKDSDRRQRIAIERFAKRAGYDVVDWFADAAVSGADPIDARPGFSAALARIAGPQRDYSYFRIQLVLKTQITDRLVDVIHKASRALPINVSAHRDLNVKTIR
jgi:hypothetical protein